MIKPYKNTSYHNKAGRWDIEVDYEDAPQEEDANSEVYFFRVLGPKKELFTYKVLFALKAIAADAVNMGAEDERGIRVELAMYKTSHLIKAKKHKDLIVNFVSKKKWKESAPLEEFDKHSEG
ncbi:MAG: hypothetical protein KAU50_09335 [Candidatus Marinimicrobia bacterium]|nr:hypothetical protein [Candidatus Neomarinimicrobiota bacterium]